MLCSAECILIQLMLFPLNVLKFSEIKKTLSKKKLFLFCSGILEEYHTVVILIEQFFPEFIHVSSFYTSLRVVAVVVEEVVAADGAVVAIGASE